MYYKHYRPVKALTDNRIITVSPRVKRQMDLLQQCRRLEMEMRYGTKIK